MSGDHNQYQKHVLKVIENSNDPIYRIISACGLSTANSDINIFALERVIEDIKAAERERVPQNDLRSPVMMTDRDLIAIEAMKELMKHFDFELYRNDPMRVACWSYDVADSMLKARELPQNDFSEFFGSTTKEGK
jgi:hypothetical protein